MCISKDGICYGAVTATSPNFHVLIHASLYLIPHVQNGSVWISPPSVTQGYRMTKNLTSRMFLVAVTEEERF